MNSDACNQSWNKAQEQHPEFNEFAKDMQKRYYDPSPEPIKYAGGAATILYKRELKMNIYNGYYVDIKDMGRIMVGKQWKF